MWPFGFLFIFMFIYPPLWLSRLHILKCNSTADFQFCRPYQKIIRAVDRREFVDTPNKFIGCEIGSDILNELYSAMWLWNLVRERASFDTIGVRGIRTDYSIPACACVGRGWLLSLGRFWLWGVFWGGVFWGCFWGVFWGECFGEVFWGGVLGRCFPSPSPPSPPPSLLSATAGRMVVIFVLPR